MMNRLERQRASHKTLRDLAIAYLGEKCTRCGATHKLHIHHKDKNVKNNSKENLELLCDRCHGKEHGNFFSSEREYSGNYIRTNIYVLEPLWTEFKDICLREGESMSRKISRFLNQYTQAHAPGNPQLKMSSYVVVDEPQPMRVKCLFIDGAVSDGRVHCRRAAKWISGVECYSCEKNLLRKKK